MIHTTIMPTFNQSKYILKSIASVLAQNAGFMHELIVVDDGSSDKTPLILNKFREHPIVRVFRFSKNCGKGEAVRFAYGESSGKYVTVLDSDDLFISKNRIQKHIDFLTNNDDCAVVASPHLVFRNPWAKRKAPFTFPQGRFSLSSVISGEAGYYHTSGTTFRRIPIGLPEIFSSNVGFRGDTALLWYHLYKSQGLMGTLDQELSAYRLNPSGIWNSASPERRFDLYESLVNGFSKLAWVDGDVELHHLLDSQLKRVSQIDFDQ